MRSFLPSGEKDVVTSRHGSLRAEAFLSEVVRARKKVLVPSAGPVQPLGSRLPLLPKAELGDDQAAECNRERNRC